MDSFAVYCAQGHVQVDTDSSAVRSLLEREIGTFFGTGQAPDGCPLLGTLRAQSRAYDPPLSGNGVPLSLHSGSHDYDIRRSLVHVSHEGLRVIDSYDTGSVILIDDANRIISLFNPNEQVLAVDSRRLIRDQILVPFFESLGGVTYHSAAFELDGIGFLAAGDRGAGKTTVFFSAMVAELASRRFLSCERTIVLPVGTELRMQACPEIISLFPGTLRSFRATRPIAPAVAPALEWARSAKKPVAWRQLFDLFGVVAEPANPRLSVVLLPRWTPDVHRIDACSISADQAEAELIQHQMTHLSVNKPNWLGWFKEADSVPTARLVAGCVCLALRWSDPHALARWLEDFVAGGGALDR